ncbi:AAA family ATPase [Shewanella psychrophila]|nr:AAA family ATPase [Shewanella psychrophila]
MRGLPGSGKSYWIDEFLRTKGIDIAINTRNKGVFSTDSFFYDGKRYRFDSKKLSEYHQRNLTGFIQALSTFEPIVICDNTNLAHWEFMAYETAAKALGYQVRIVLIGEPKESAHQALCAERNSHNVPLAQIQRMAKQFEAF